MDIYREQIIDLYENPLNHGELDPHDFSYEEDNPLCGDVIRIDVRLDEEGKVAEIVKHGWQAEGKVIKKAHFSAINFFGL